MSTWKHLIKTLVKKIRMTRNTLNSPSNIESTLVDHHNKDSWMTRHTLNCSSRIENISMNCNEKLELKCK